MCEAVFPVSSPTDTPGVKRYRVYGKKILCCQFDPTQSGLQALISYSYQSFFASAKEKLVLGGVSKAGGTSIVAAGSINLVFIKST